MRNFKELRIRFYCEYLHICWLLRGTKMSGWIGVDLDGTLAHYDGWKGDCHIGEPVPRMLQRVKDWLSQGIEVRILTARVSPDKGEQAVLVAQATIGRWCLKHLGIVLPMTHSKDMRMLELWDDRAVQVIPNTGIRADGKE